MMDTLVEWNKEQIVEAFREFRSSKTKIDNEKSDNKLRDLLNNLGKDYFEASDVFFITEQFVPAHCAGKLALAIIHRLEENASLK